MFISFPIPGSSHFYYNLLTTGRYLTVLFIKALSFSIFNIGLIRSIGFSGQTTVFDIAILFCKSQLPVVNDILLLYIILHYIVLHKSRVYPQSTPANPNKTD